MQRSKVQMLLAEPCRPTCVAVAAARRPSQLFHSPTRSTHPPTPPTFSRLSSCASLASSLHRCLQMRDRQANRCCSCSGSRSRPARRHSRFIMGLRRRFGCWHSRCHTPCHQRPPTACRLSATRLLQAWHKKMQATSKPAPTSRPQQHPCSSTRSAQISTLHQQAHHNYPAPASQPQKRSTAKHPPSSTRSARCSEWPHYTSKPAT